MPSLHAIALARIEPAPGFSIPLVQHLAERPKLRTLELRDPKGSLSYHMLAFIRSIRQPYSLLFADLENLKLSGDIDWNVCGALFPHLTKLRSLSCSFKFSVNDPSAPSESETYEWILAKLPASPHLDYLALRCLHRQQRSPSILPLKLSGSSLIRLAEKYRKLHSLILSRSHSGIDGSGITDADIDVLASLLPNLAVLRIGFRLPLQKLTTQCLDSLAKHCPRLEECELLGDFDITSATLGRSCLFPRLHYFAILVPRENCWADQDFSQLRNVLEHHFPQLKSLAGVCARDWPHDIVSVRPPWEIDKLRCFVDGLDEEDERDSDWSTIKQ
jgi:hypothetical protein